MITSENRLMYKSDEILVKKGKVMDHKDGVALLTVAMQVEESAMG